MNHVSMVTPARAWLVSRLRFNTPALDRDQIVPLQLLRGLAASGVVIEHLLERYVRRGAILDDLPGFTSRLGQTGVAAFFAISGFIMVYISSRADRGPPSGTAFLRNRFLRVAPLYYIMTIFIVLFGLATQPFASSAVRRVPTLGEILFSFAFIPHRGANGLIQPIYGLGWTLHYEMFFYLLFALGLMLWARRGALLVLGVLAIFVAVGTGIDAPPESWGWRIVAYVFTRPIMGYFAIGIALALIRQRVHRHLPVLPMPLIAFIAMVALITAAMMTERALTMTAVAVALATTAFTISKPVQRAGMFSRFCRVFGDASYSIYLTHSFVLGAFAVATASVAGLGPVALISMAALACLICFVVGWLTWRLVELPVADWLHYRRTKLELVAP